jgi:hypothetical protein
MGDAGKLCSSQMGLIYEERFADGLNEEWITRGRDGLLVIKSVLTSTAVIFRGHAADEKAPRALRRSRRPAHGLTRHAYLIETQLPTKATGLVQKVCRLLGMYRSPQLWQVPCSSCVQGNQDFPEKGVSVSLHAREPRFPRERCLCVSSAVPH